MNESAKIETEEKQAFPSNKLALPRRPLHATPAPTTKNKKSKRALRTGREHKQQGRSRTARAASASAPAGNLPPQPSHFIIGIPFHHRRIQKISSDRATPPRRQAVPSRLFPPTPPRMAPSPVTCRPSAARHRPLLVRAPAPRAADGAALMLPLPLRRREALLAAAARPHARWIAADPWASAHAWTSPGRGRGDATRCAAAGRVAGSSSAGAGRSAGMEVAIAAAAVVAMGTGNRVLYKLALVPLREYPFFLAQFATFGCVRAPPPPLSSRFVCARIDRSTVVVLDVAHTLCCWLLLCPIGSRHRAVLAWAWKLQQ
jgi:hypothetical protein